jgi:hypothetical protein
LQETVMKRKKTALERAVSDRTTIQMSRDQIMSRPDGYYWRTLDGRTEFGPFDDLDMAVADMESVDEETPTPGETLQEAEDEIGISDWIDPDTGELAEGMSHPRVEDR